MSVQPTAPDVARLVCGNIDDLRNYLPGVTDPNLLARAIYHCLGRAETKTKRLMLVRALRKLDRAAPAAPGKAQWASAVRKAFPEGGPMLPVAQEDRP